MRDYRNTPWMSASFCSIPPPPAPPYYASTPQPPQPSQSTSPVEQAILSLTKLVGDFVEEQKTINAHLSQKIDTVESTLNQRLDGLKDDMFQKCDNLQHSISSLVGQLQCHPEEENSEEVCLSDPMMEGHCKQKLQEEFIENFIELSEGLSESSDVCVVVCPWEKKEEILPLLSKEGSGKEASKALDNQLYILPTPAVESNAIPAAKAKANQSEPHVQNLRKLVATVQNFATTSKTLAAAHIAWHSGWLGCSFRHGASGPQQFH